MNKLYDCSDKIDFGQMRGERFIWIYLLGPTYLEWLIKNTKICFIDLEHFYSFGKPLKLLFEDLEFDKQEIVYDIIKENNIDVSIINKPSYIITNNKLDEITKLDFISEHHFQLEDHFFTEEILSINSNKLKNCKPISNLNVDSDMNLNENIKLIYKKHYQSDLQNNVGEEYTIEELKTLEADDIVFQKNHGFGIITEIKKSDDKTIRGEICFNKSNKKLIVFDYAKLRKVHISNLIFPY